MKIKEIIDLYIKKIPKDDIYLLISSFLNCKKLDIIKYYDLDIDYSKIEKLFKRYENKEPINYILKSKEFYGLNFYVDERVLIPRFETEILVEKVINKLQKIDNKKLNLLDLCCGSGNIGLTLKYNLEELNVDLVDISNEALEVAKINMNNLNLNVNIINSDLFKKLNKKYDVIVCNPPYLAEDEASYQTDKYEPHLALYTKDGIEIFERIFKNISNYLNPNFLIFLEIGDGHYKKIEKVINKYLKNIKINLYYDYNDRERIVIIESL